MIHVLSHFNVFDSDKNNFATVSMTLFRVGFIVVFYLQIMLGVLIITKLYYF